MLVDEENLQAFAKAVDEKNIAEADKYFSRYCDPQRLPRWQALSVEQQQRFLASCHRFTRLSFNGHYAEKTARKAFKKAHLLYCRLVKYCIADLDLAEQISFYQQAGDFYSQQRSYADAMDYYARALTLTESLAISSSSHEYLATCLLEKISQLEITWYQENGQSLAAITWKTYLVLLDELSVTLKDEYLQTEICHPVILNKLKTLQEVTEQLMQAGAWQLVDRLYRKAAKLMRYYQGFLLRQLNNLLAPLLDTTNDFPDVSLSLLQETLQQIDGFAQQLCQHRQWPMAIACYESMLQALNTNRSAALSEHVLIELEAKELQVKKIQAADECKEDKLLPLPATYQPKWNTYRLALKQLREAFQQGLASHTSIFTVQKAYSQGVRDLLEKLIADSVQRLGSPPTAFCMIAGGSLGRHAMAPYSDLDIAILLKEAIHGHDPYWHRLLESLQFQLKTLGELWIIEKQKILQPCGLHIDKGDLKALLQTGSRLIQTPENLARWVVSQCQQPSACKREDFILAYGLWHTFKLFTFEPASSEAAPDLLNDYQNALSQHLALPLPEAGLSASATLCHQQIGQTLFEENRQSVYQKALQLTARDSSSTVDLKDQYLKPLICWCTDIGLWAGIGAAETYALISDIPSSLEVLATTRSFHPQWLASLQAALATVESIRCRLQLLHQGLTVITKPDWEVPRGSVALSPEDYQALQAITRYIITPAYEGTLLRQTAPLLLRDPPLIMWEQAIAQWWKSKAQQEETPSDSLQAALAGWLSHLAYRHAPVHAYYQAFNAFRVYSQCHPILTRAEAWAFRSQFNSLVKNCTHLQGMFPPLTTHQVKAILVCLGQYPEPNGFRPALKRENKVWQQTLTSLFVAMDSPLLKQQPLPRLLVTYVVSTQVEGQPYSERKQAALHPKLVQWLIAQKKLKKTRQGYAFTPKEQHLNPTHGRHNVIEVNTLLEEQRIRIHLKPFPEMPGMEFAAGALARRLVGSGLPPVALVRFHLYEGDCPVLISQTIIGENLRKLNDQLAIPLDEKYYSQRIIVSLLLNQEDAKAANIMAVPGAGGKVSLISVDNDRSFYPAVVSEENTGELTPLVKDISYCFMEVNQRIHADARDELLVLDIFALLKSWLFEVQKMSLEIAALFKPKEMETFFPKQSTVGMFMDKLSQWRQGGPTTCILPIPLREKLVTELYHKLNTLQASLIHEPSLTHMACLKKLEPLLAKYYQHLLKRYPEASARQRFKAGFKRYYGIDENEEEVTQSTSLETFQTVYGHAIAIKELLQSQDQSAKKVLVELKATHHARRGLGQIKRQLLQCQAEGLAALRELSSHELHAMIINAPDFDFSQMRKESGEINVSYQQAVMTILEQTKTCFTLLKLANCQALTSLSLITLLKHSHTIQRLDISGCLGLDESVFNQLAVYPSLAKLKANGLTQLTQIKMRQSLWRSEVWRGITYLELQDCTRLESLQLRVPALVSLKLEGAIKLNWSKFSLQAERLKKLSLAGCAYSIAQKEALLKALRPHTRLTQLQLPRDEGGSTLIIQLARRNDLGPLQQLVQQGASVEDKATNGFTALCYAARDGHLEAVQYLVEAAQAAIEAESNNGDTALSLAAWQGHMAVVRYLQGQGASLQHKNKANVTPLMLAAQNGKTEMVRWLCEQGASVEDRDNNGFTALLYVAHYGHLEALQYLVATAQAAIEAEDNEGDTALSLAAWQGHVGVVRYLQGQGASLQHKRRIDNQTLLMAAASNGKTEMVRWLCEQGASVEDKATNGFTALCYAAREGHLEAVQYLVGTAQAVIEAEDNEGATALMYAAWKGDVAVVRYLQSQGASLQHKSKGNQTLLMAAASNGKMEMVRWLCEQGASVEDKATDGFTALCYAAHDGHLEVVQYLVETAQAAIEAEDNEGDTALSLAAWQGRVGVVRYLQGQGASLQHKRRIDNQTPLMAAAKNGKTEMVRWLCEQGASVEDKDTNNGWTALLYAACNGHLEAVQYLVEAAQAAIEAEDNEGDTALNLAAWQGHVGVVRYLQGRGASLQHKRRVDNQTPLMAAAKNGKTEMVRWLYEQGVSVKDKDTTNGWTALLYAARYGHLDAVQYLVEKAQAAIEAEDNEGWTALLYAVRYGHLDAVQYLVETAQAAIEAEDNKGATALSLAAWQGHLEMVRYLQGQGTSLQHKNKANVTPLMFAASNGKTEMVRWLYEQGASVEDRDNTGFTALYHAICNGHAETVSFLSANGNGQEKNDPVYFYCSAFYKEERGLYEEALNDYTEALRLKPDYVDALSDRGFTYKRVKHHQAAVADFQKAVRLNSDRGYPHYSLARYAKKGLISAENLPDPITHYYQEALTLYQKRIAIDKQDTAAYYRLGVMHQFGRGTAQDEKKAIDYYNLALENPGREEFRQKSLKHLQQLQALSEEQMKLVAGIVGGVENKQLHFAEQQNHTTKTGLNALPLCHERIVKESEAQPLIENDFTDLPPLVEPDAPLVEANAAPTKASERLLVLLNNIQQRLDWCFPFLQRMYLSQTHHDYLLALQTQLYAYQHMDITMLEESSLLAVITQLEAQQRYLQDLPARKLVAQLCVLTRLQQTFQEVTASNKVATSQSGNANEIDANLIDLTHHITQLVFAGIKTSSDEIRKGQLYFSPQQGFISHYFAARKGLEAVIENQRNFAEKEAAAKESPSLSRVQQPLFFTPSAEKKDQRHKPMDKVKEKAVYSEADNKLSLAFPAQAKEWLGFCYHQGGLMPISRIDKVMLSIEMIGEDLKAMRNPLLEELGGYIQQAVDEVGEQAMKWQVDEGGLTLQFENESITQAVIELLVQVGFTLADYSVATTSLSYTL